jgi:hypothetical protein
MSEERRVGKHERRIGIDWRDSRAPRAAEVGEDLRQRYKDATPEERQRLIHEHDCPKAWAFHTKYAVGSKLCPSCFACGKQEHDPSKWAIKHLELPDIYICETCANALSSRPTIIEECARVREAAKSRP